MTKFYNISKLKSRRIDLRRRETRQESILWWHLQAKRIGYKFRRQHSISGYILDFYCLEKKLIIEIDGGIHNTREIRLNDAVRDKFFRDLDYTILRFTNDQVDSDIFKVLTKIKSTLAKI